MKNRELKNGEWSWMKWLSVGLCFGPLLRWKEILRAEKARAYAGVCYKIVVGEDDTFEETYGGKAREVIRNKGLWKRGEDE